MKVYEQSGYHYKSTPAIMLKGQWLRELGFEENTPIVVHCEEGILTITRADAEADYLDVGTSESESYELMGTGFTKIDCRKCITQRSIIRSKAGTAADVCAEAFRFVGV